MDLTSQWAFLQKHKHHAGAVLLAIVTFIAGWQVGKITSPYYAAQPIVFEDRQCAECASSGGSAEELSALKKPDTPVGQGSGAAPSPTPAGKGSVAGTQEETKQQEPSVQKFVGSVNSNLYHDPTCSSVSRINEANQIWFASQEDARAAGYSPSKCTQRLLGEG